MQPISQSLEKEDSEVITQVTLILTELELRSRYKFIKANIAVTFAVS